MVKHILIVDDDEDQIYVIKDFFYRNYQSEYLIISALSGKECLTILKDTIPDLIILDLMMPVMSGWELFDILKEQDKWKKIPIIILTARNDIFAEDAGKIAEDYITKPINLEELKLRIDLVLNKH